MTPKERRRAVGEHLDNVGASSYQDLAQQFGVSEMTIRRDIDRLVELGQVVKTLGGAQTAHAPDQFYESSIQQRLLQHREEKEQIAQAALARIAPKQTIFLDGSTTCLVLARHLAKQSLELTVVTYSALVCREFAGTSESTVYSVGGQFDPASGCFIGPVAEKAARQFFVDTAFYSTKGFVPEEGTFEASVATFRIKQIMAEQSSRRVLLVDHTKFRQRSLCKVLDTRQIQEVITDSLALADDVALLEERGVTVTIAPRNQRLKEGLLRGA